MRSSMQSITSKRPKLSPERVKEGFTIATNMAGRGTDIKLLRRRNGWASRHYTERFYPAASTVS